MKKLFDLAVGDRFEVVDPSDFGQRQSVPLFGQKQSGPLPACPNYVMCYLGFNFREVLGDMLVRPV